METEYLFVFGYEDPTERASNDSAGTDFESSSQVRILAADRAQAFKWGQEIAQLYVATLYEDAAKDWQAERFAAWIDDNPDERLRQYWASIPLVRIGEHPPHATLLPTALSPDG